MAKILIIEDETSLLDLYTEVLSSAGHTVISATDGEQGLQKALSEDWTILFLDIMLPGMDGLSILKRIREANLLTSRYVIMLTTLDNPSVLTESLNLGASEHLNKASIVPQALLNLVEKYVLESA